MVTAGVSDKEMNETVTEDESDKLVPKRNIYWQWFGFQKEHVKQNAIICKTWHKTIATKGRSTTNLFHHLRNHPLQNEECFKVRMSTSPHTPQKTLNKPAMTQMTLASSFAKVIPYDKKKGLCWPQTVTVWMIYMVEYNICFWRLVKHIVVYIIYHDIAKKQNRPALLLDNVLLL